MADFTPVNPWLKADQFEEGERRVLTIKTMTEDEVGQEKELKWVLTFKETDKKIVLNKGMQTNLAAALGTTESDEAVGKKIELYVEDGVRNPAGGTVSAVRISKKPVKAGAAKAKPAPAETDSAGDDF